MIGAINGYGIPITALMFRTFFAGIPDELLDAATIDGCGFFRIFRWLMLPVAPPVIAVVMLWQFTTIWNDYILAVEWNVRMAGALIAALPTIVVYLLLGKLFMRGLLAGAVKG